MSRLTERVPSIRDSGRGHRRHRLMVVDGSLSALTPYARRAGEPCRS